MRGDTVTVVSVSLPMSLLKNVDALSEQRSYAGRSEVVRAALRDFVTRELQEPERSGDRTATMTLVYPKGHERRIGEIRHDFGDVVKSLTHSDSDENCVEVFLLGGNSDRIREFADRLRAYRETRIAQILFTDVDAPRARPRQH